jgi:hypothetical protein
MSTIGTQTIRFPSMIVPTACFQSMPAETRLAASM